MGTQKLMWCNIMKLTKSQKVSILHYSIDKKWNSADCGILGKTKKKLLDVIIGTMGFAI